MRKYRFTAIIMSLLLLFQTFPAVAYSIEDIVLSPSDDSYIDGGSRWQRKNYGSAKTMLFGDSYDRTALLKFDLSNIDLSAYNGALLNIVFSAAAESATIEAYVVDADWNEKNVNYANFSFDYTFAISSAVSKGEKQKLSLVMNQALATAKKNNLNSLTIALKCNNGCISAYTSEASDKTLRPSLLLTEDIAYIAGQRDFKFPNVTRQDFKNELVKAIEKGHPYIIANKESVNKVKDLAFGKDEFLTHQYSLLKKKAEALLLTEVPVIGSFVEKGESFIGKATQIWEDSFTLGLVYLVEGDERFAQRLYNMIENACKLESWGQKQMIDIGMLSVGVSVCYDWLYDWMSPEQREVIVSGFKRLHLDVIADVYRNPKSSKYKSSFYQVIFNTNGNHNVIDSSTIFISAMAFADVDVDLAAELMENSIGPFSACIAHMYPDGVWAEGLSYWNYVGPYTARWLQAMLSAFGHAFGYEDLSLMKSLAKYPITAEGTNGAFMQGDAHFGQSNKKNAAYYLIGKLAGDEGLMNYAKDLLTTYDITDAINILVYEPSASDEKVSMDLDVLLRGSLNLATLRSYYEGSQYIFGGMSVRQNTTTWSHVDRGTLALDALGERWITNNSKEIYYDGYNNGSGKRFNWYRARPEANSCIVINPSTYRGQELNTDLGIEVFESDVGGGYAISDLTRAYELQVESYKRGIQLADNRKVFVVQDEVVMKEPSELYSFFNIYDSDIEILSDGKSAILSKHNKKVYVRVDCDQEFTLQQMYAESLPESAKPEDPLSPNSPNMDFLKLAIHLDNVKEANIRVSFMPYIFEEELIQFKSDKLVPMSEWVASKEIKSLPLLDSIKIDGIELNGFHKYNRCYDLVEDLELGQVEPIYDSNKYNMTLSKDDVTGAVSILLVDKTDSENMNSYSLAVPFVPSPSYVDTSKMTVLPLVKTEAPEPQPDNSIVNLFDDDNSTRWSADGYNTSMLIELDRKRTVGCIGVSILNGDTRRQYFDVMLSLDGKTWTQAGRFTTCGTTLDMEYFDLNNTDAKYVKILWNSSSAGSWNSVTELKIYGN